MAYVLCAVIFHDMALSALCGRGVRQGVNLPWRAFQVLVACSARDAAPCPFFLRCLQTQLKPITMDECV